MVSGGPLVVLTGPPGAGKTTVARELAARFQPPACLLESDWWWTTIVSGRIPPWDSSAHDQNRTVAQSFAAAACIMAQGGYSTILEGVVGPWMLDLIRQEAQPRGVVTHYLVLRPSLDATLQRAKSRAGEERVPGHPALTDEGPLRKMWQAFAQLAEYEDNVIDTTGLTVAETVTKVWSKVTEGSALLRTGAENDQHIDSPTLWT